MQTLVSVVPSRIYAERPRLGNNIPKYNVTKQHPSAWYASLVGVYQLRSVAVGPYNDTLRLRLRLR